MMTCKDLEALIQAAQKRMAKFNEKAQGFPSELANAFYQHLHCPHNSIEKKNLADGKFAITLHLRGATVTVNIAVSPPIVDGYDLIASVSGEKCGFAIPDKMQEVVEHIVNLIANRIRNQTTTSEIVIG